MSSAAQIDNVRGFVMLNPGDLERILASHKAFLAHAKEGRRANLVSTYLARADLSNCLLAKADLSGAVLTGACLKFGNFADAMLYCSEMGNVDARYANFAQADMRGVTITGSNLSHARLDGADFRPGRMFKTSGATSSDRNGVAAGVDFSYCSIVGATFEGADLKGADFTGALITSTKFKGARMNGATLKGAILTDVDVNELPADALKDCILPPNAKAIGAREKILFQLAAHQNWIDSGARRGTCAVLDDFDLRPIAGQIGKFKLTAIFARRAIAAGIDFSCTELQGANFEGADLRGASFEGADLRGVRFKGAQLQHARFLGADMRPLQLDSGELLPCDLTDTAFSPLQQAEAVFS